MTAKALPPDRLYTACDPQRFSFDSTQDLQDIEAVPGQERALDALQFAIRMPGKGYNLFALGPSGMGKFTTIRQILAREAASRPVPSDWCYVHNFKDPRHPRALELPPGTGTQLKADLDQFIEDLRGTLSAAFESEHYQSRVHQIEEDAKKRDADAINELAEESREQNIALVQTPHGFAFAPTDSEGEVLSPEQFEKFDEKERKRIEKEIAELQQKLQKVLRQVPVWHRESYEKFKKLNREVAGWAVGSLLDTLVERYTKLPDVLQHLGQVREHVIDNIDELRGESDSSSLLSPHQASPADELYRVNLIVDRAGQKGALVIYEDLPTYANLNGRCEHRAQMGTLVTDFTMIRPGALHRANGGYLILDVRKVLTQPFAWELLKRTLRSGQIRVESLERTLSLISADSIEPQPIPLDVKVVLVGDRLLYYLLYELDPEFQDHFKVAADFEDTLSRSDDNEQVYARLIAMLARHAGVRSVGRDAVARVVDHCARLAADAEKLSAHLGSITDLLREAEHHADLAAHPAIMREDVEAALSAQLHRSSRISRRIQEEIQRGTLIIATEGGVVGEINGLAVHVLGGFHFGRPVRITATVRLGEGEVVDIEREAELGGEIHSKGVMILSRFLASHYAAGQMLSISASVVFEQSYEPVEGDSASLAELCALLSALAEIPIRQGLAVTGSVNQHGTVQPIGAVNEKIEGFFDVCNARGLTGDQGVLIPAANVKHLMLRADVVEAAANGRFHVYPVETVDDALELLTGEVAGERGKDGSFPADSLNRRVEEKLLDFSATRERFVRQLTNMKSGPQND